ncbi:MAG: cytochrome c3 family protein, partial [Azoarcus sp.]|nr:cytochrome c3 family protein [Azoarcus sp.]
MACEIEKTAGERGQVVEAFSVRMMTFVIAMREATWQSMKRFSHQKHRDRPKGCLDCHGPSALAMTKVLGVTARVWGIAMPSIPVIARRVAPWQSMRRFNFLKRRYNLNRLLDCHGPAALAFDEGLPV